MTEPKKSPPRAGDLIPGFEVLLQMIETFHGVANAHGQEALRHACETILRTGKSMLADAQKEAEREVTLRNAMPHVCICERCGHS